jgi:hypothetical protein
MRSFYPIRVLDAVMALSVMLRAMRTRPPRAALAGLALLAVAAPTASAAQIATDRGCYLESTATRVTMGGAGFKPGAPYQVLLDGKPLPNGSGTVDANGNVTGTFTPPALSADKEATHTLTVQEGTNTAETSFSVTRFLADFTPGSGNPSTLRVRFAAYGFSLAKPNATVFVHYVKPNGKLKRTVRLGTANGPCGRITRTRKRRLFPFTAERGGWKLQFDTSRRYRRGTNTSNFLFYTLGVKIRKLV